MNFSFLRWDESRDDTILYLSWMWMAYNATRGSWIEKLTEACPCHISNRLRPSPGSVMSLGHPELASSDEFLKPPGRSRVFGSPRSSRCVGHLSGNFAQRRGTRGTAPRRTDADAHAPTTASIPAVTPKRHHARNRECSFQIMTARWLVCLVAE